MVASNAMQYSLGYLSAYMSLGTTSITLVNPIVTICLVRHYREALLYLVGLRRRPIVTPQTTEYTSPDLCPTTGAQVLT